MTIFCRDDEAKLLGYPTYAHLSMETKMAGSLQSVENMLDFLLKKGNIFIFFVHQCFFVRTLC